MLAFGMLASAGLLTTAAGLAYFFSKYSQLPRIELSSVLDNETVAGDVRNVLIVGVDSAAGLDPNDPIRTQRENLGIGGLRSDTIMILHVDPAEEQAALLSLPRDLWLPIAGRGGRQRINTAVGEGGPQVLIATIQDYLNIPIHNYVQIDFAGFQDLVAAIDGVPVYFDTPARDANSGLNVPEAGCVTLAPDQALAYARSRAFQYFDDGRWRFDTTGDLGRISRQQDFMRRALRRAVSRGIRNPVTLDRLIDVGLDSVVVDNTFTADDIVGLGNRFRSFNPENLVMYGLPVVGDTVGGASIVRMVDSQAQPILELFRGGGAPGAELQPSDVRISVLNGSGRSGEARSALADLAAVGFARVSADEAESFDFTRTVLRYAPGGEAAAALVGRWLAAEPVFEVVPALEGGDVIVVTGADWAGVRATPAPGTGLPPTTTTTSTAPIGTTTSTVAATSTTATTIIGHVPEQPPEVDC
jgi:LCP family protein required for cell wall assembly